MVPVDMKAAAARVQILPEPPLTINGMRVVESPHITPVPNIQIRSDFEWCTPEFRDEMNSYLDRMFGRSERAYVFQDTMVVSPKMMVQLRIMQKDKGW
jgi:hypothetical protein